MPILSTWMEVHTDIDDAVRALRMVVVEGRTSKTRTAFRAAREMLDHHMHMEESTLFPAYRRAATDMPPNAAPRVYEADHARIRSSLDRIERSLDASEPGDLVDQLTALSELTGVLEHHDLRERTWLAPVLDAAVPQATRAAWVRAFEAAAPAPTPPPALERARSSRFSGPPIEVFGATIARDGDVVSACRAVSPPLGKRGEALHRSCQEIACRVEASPTLLERREHLLMLADRYRLLAIVAAHPPPPDGN